LVSAASNTSSKKNRRSPAPSPLFEMAFAADGKSYLSSDLAVPKVKSQRAGARKLKGEEQMVLEEQVTLRVGN
jgi:hypothetical protein